jgi:uncharacterized protein
VLDLHIKFPHYVQNIVLRAQYKLTPFVMLCFHATFLNHVLVLLIMVEVRGQVISGAFGGLIARQKSGKDFELGEIILAEDDYNTYFLQVYDLEYGSQISRQNLEMVSGLSLEEDSGLEFMDKEMRNYKLAKLKGLITIDKRNNSVILSKSLPPMFTNLREIANKDISFLSKPKSPLFFGNLRSGSKELDVPIYLDGRDVLTHHILITGTTGKGKSVLMSDLLWSTSGKDFCSMLVLDPHDEYYGKNSKNIGLKDHPSGKIVYYTTRDVPVGGRSLKINIRLLRPQHFGCLDFSEAQEQAMNAYYREYGIKWIEAIILDKTLSKVSFVEATLGVLKRRMMYLLDIDFNGEQIFCKGIFDTAAGESTIKTIGDDLESNKTVIIDTSSFSGQLELLVGSMITTEIFYRYKNYKIAGTLDSKPIISIVLEEAPRVLGKEVLEKGSNIFSTLAREGRKFNVGLIAITQLPSLIPREILANMNTKIILGTDMINERQAIIDSASQDLSSDSRAIASLDRGECILSSNFAKFAIPIKVPLFQELAKRDIAQIRNHPGTKLEYSGIKMEDTHGG